MLNDTFPASTRRSTSSSSPSYQTWRLLLASNSRWLSKSTLTCRRCPTTPVVRIAYCGFGVIVGKPALQPEIACWRSNEVHLRLRNWSALSSMRRLSCMPMSAYCPKGLLRPAPWKTRGAPGAGAPGVSAPGAGAGACATAGAGGASGGARPGRHSARTARSHCAAMNAAGTRGPSRPPGCSAGTGRTASVGTGGKAPCARAGGTTSVVAKRKTRAGLRIPCSNWERRI